MDSGWVEGRICGDGMSTRRGILGASYRTGAYAGSMVFDISKQSEDRDSVNTWWW